MYAIEISTDLTSWLARPAVWDGLSRGVPFRETSWLASWWRHLASGFKGYLVIARDPGGAVRGLLPLYQDPSGTRGRTLRVLGDGQACSDDVSVLATDADAASVAEAMGRFLVEIAGDRTHGWDLIDIDGIVEGDVPMATLARTLQEGGAILHASSRMSTWFAPCQGSWEAYWVHVSKSHRRKLQQVKTRYEKTAGLEHRIIAAEADLAPPIDALIELHQQRWRSVGERGTYADPRFRHFIHDAACSFALRQRLHLSLLQLDGRTIAAELNFLGGNRRAYCYSTGYDIDQAALEPGRMLCVQTLMHAHQAEWAGIDFLRGDEPYKERMQATPRRLLRLRAVAPALVPRIRHAAWRTQFELKQWIRRRAGRKPVDVVEVLA